MDDEHLRSRLSQLAPSVDTAAGWQALQTRLAEFPRGGRPFPLDEDVQEEKRC